MNPPLQPARIDFTDAAAPRAVDFDDLYHPRAGAFEQARHVFLAGNALPQRWAGRTHFVVLETGFGLGNNFLATWAAWRDDPARCAHLWFLSLDKHPPQSADLQRAHAHSAEPALAQALIDAWPPLTPDLHRCDFADERVHLLLALGDIDHWLPQWMVDVDAFYLDGFAPARNAAMWTPHVLQRLVRLAAPGATAATWSTARSVRDALADAGFVIERRDGFDTKRDMLCARHAPTHRATRPAGRRFGTTSVSDGVAVVGAGLAGAGAARALAALGVPCRVFDALPGPAHGASGQPGALVHGVLHADDSPHTRWFRACALRASAVIAPLLAQGHAVGDLSGLLRAERTLDHDAMRALLAEADLPPQYVRALARNDAAALTGCAMTGPAWHYPHGGWVDPRSVVRAWLDHRLITTTASMHVQRIERDADGRWCLFDNAGRVIDRCAHLVLANADDAQRLVAHERWPLSRSRGQVTLLPAHAVPRPPRVPLAGDGYAITLPSGELLCGATTDVDDSTIALRDADHRHNLDAWQRLSGQTVAVDLQAIDGRVGWRVHARDRLPLVGGVPLPAHERHGRTRQEQPRFIERCAGLHVLTALGSRGATQAALLGEVLAAMITGTPLPLGSGLLDAVDAARFSARDARVPDLAARAS